MFDAWCTGVSLLLEATPWVSEWDKAIAGNPENSKSDDKEHPFPDKYECHCSKPQTQSSSAYSFSLSRDWHLARAILSSPNHTAQDNVAFVFAERGWLWVGLLTQYHISNLAHNRRFRTVKTVASTQSFRAYDHSPLVWTPMVLEKRGRQRGRYLCCSADHRGPPSQKNATSIS